MPRKALVTARAALRFAHKAAGEFAGNSPPCDEVVICTHQPAVVETRAAPNDVGAFTPRHVTALD